ncbi:NAD(P)H-binding protein [Maricaulis sp.]|uniref:NmrA family NAD(P)-binding protein n=1 Tax=Maricaulis sp. TaxID=1486257 RepID=UPI00260F550D|nr:NAD(P)H-binding protein [Maricaulis sp.]
MPASNDNMQTGPVLVLGSTGKTGRRITERLKARGIEVREGSRRASPAFSWQEPDGWDAVLAGMRSVYVNYAPDLAVPGAADAIRLLMAKAKTAGVEHVVLLSGRGEEEAQNCEAIVQASGLSWSIVRAGWFNQNFSEGAFVDMVREGVITLPAGDIGEAFIDVDDIADVATAALIDRKHAGELYELTGPRLLTFHDIADELSRATGRKIEFVRIPREAFSGALADAGTPEDVAWLLDYLFHTVLDGRNASLTDGVERALGRKPRDFSDFAQRVAATGLWSRAA